MPNPEDIAFAWIAADLGLCERDAIREALGELREARSTHPISLLLQRSGAINKDGLLVCLHLQSLLGSWRPAAFEIDEAPAAARPQRTVPALIEGLEHSQELSPEELEVLRADYEATKAREAAAAAELAAEHARAEAAGDSEPEPAAADESRAGEVGPSVRSGSSESALRVVGPEDFGKKESTYDPESSDAETVHEPDPSTVDDGSSDPAASQGDVAEPATAEAVPEATAPEETTRRTDTSVMTGSRAGGSRSTDSSSADSRASGSRATGSRAADSKAPVSDELDAIGPGRASRDTTTTRHRKGGRLKPGEIFSGYRIESQIARGGMGVLYKAREAKLERTVALKILSTRAAQSKTLLARFQREAKLCARMRHPNIVAVHDVGEHRGIHYFTMDYIDGAPLDKLLDRGKITPHRAVEHAATIARALHYAHKRGVLHRDVKPANLLVDAEDRVLITDFGLAKDVTTSDMKLTRIGIALGTPAYMSPEQASGNFSRVDRRSDIYSLATVLYEALTGQVPFSAESLGAIIRKIRHEPPAPMVELRPDLPVALDATLARAMAKEPEHRWRNAEAFAEELEACLHDPMLLSARAVRRGSHSGLMRVRRGAASSGSSGSSGSGSSSGRTSSSYTDQATPSSGGGGSSGGSVVVASDSSQVSVRPPSTAGEVDPIIAGIAHKLTERAMPAVTPSDPGDGPVEATARAAEAEPVVEAETVAEADVVAEAEPVEAELGEAATETTSTVAPAEPTPAVASKSSNRSVAAVAPRTPTERVSVDPPVPAAPVGPARHSVVRLLAGAVAALIVVGASVVAAASMTEPAEGLRIRGNIADVAVPALTVDDTELAGAVRVLGPAVPETLLPSVLEPPIPTTYDLYALSQRLDRRTVEVARASLADPSVDRAQLGSALDQSIGGLIVAARRLLDGPLNDHHVPTAEELLQRGVTAEAIELLERVVTSDASRAPLLAHARMLEAMVFVPAGRAGNAEPAFYIDRTEMTVATYARFVEAVAAGGAAEWASPDAPKDKDHAPAGGLPSDPAAPIAGVDWFDAYAAARWSGKRLPTPREHARAIGWPDDAPPSPVATTVLFGDRLAAPLPAALSPVAEAPCGAVGLLGNVAEWCGARRDEATVVGGSLRDAAPPTAPRREPAETRSEWIGVRCVADPLPADAR